MRNHLTTTGFDFRLHKLAIGCNSAEDLITKNDVSFITFNYDVSLEYNLYRGLSAISFFQENNCVKRFFQEKRSFICTGKIRENPLAKPFSLDFDLSQYDPGALLHRTAYYSFFKQILEASVNIRTIAPEEKIVDDEVRNAGKLVKSSRCLYILGYGFDAYNSHLLGFSTIGENLANARYILFTNFQDGNNVNKRASTALFKRPDLLSLPGSTVRNFNRVYCEKCSGCIWSTCFGFRCS